MHHYYLFHKPYEMLSQFTGGDRGLRMIGDLGHDFPAGIHAVGRLDYHSEGLLLLTTNPAVTRLLFQGDMPHTRTYVVQAYKEITAATLDHLRSGVRLKIKGGLDYTTAPCRIEVIARPAGLAFAPHELSAFIPGTWLEISLTEGKYRQIRKMLRTVGHPCRRLVRTSIEDLALGKVAPGDILELEESAFFRLLRLPVRQRPVKPAADTIPGA